MRNRLEIEGAEFRSTIKPFANKRARLDEALLAFEGGFLSIEAGEVTVVMRAEGEWHGRASFSKNALVALSTVPPTHSPIVVEYDGAKLKIGTMTIAAEWSAVSQAFLDKIEHPTLLDLLAMDRTLPRSHFGRTGLGPQVRSARDKLERRIKGALGQLAELDVTDAEIRNLVESKIQQRLKKG